ncbi:unnamed protein product [Miscanthus lutarioriparius]|uniref:DUF3615 domain-containing protein n=1 Tax=Miscanthus lutarioriparius TaxID=422564 RepID=A0A811Q0P8_9POAL|nr:unnamed protein product [Miscanthus lutarioriparius]
MLRRKSRDEAEDATPRQMRRKSPSSLSSSKQLPAALCPPQNGSWVQQPPCEVGVFDQCDSNNVDDSSDEASIAELSVKVFRSLPPDDAVACYTRFCNNAKACIKHYNTKYQHDHGFGLIIVGEQDGSDYYHLNFHARDKKGHSQLFFGEIMVCVSPEEEDVTCCHPVSLSDVGGKCIQTLEEMKDCVFPPLGTAGMDNEYCYGCSPTMKHQEGTRYVAGHVADSRHYYMPSPDPDPED